MNKSQLTEKQIEAAERYILLRGAEGAPRRAPEAGQRVTVKWKQLVMLVAEYGAIRAGSVARGGSVEEPGEVCRTQHPKLQVAGSPRRIEKLKSEEP